MSPKLLAPFFVAAALILAGCATPTKMAFHKDTETVTSTTKPIFLMTATLKNSYRQSYQPKVIVLNVEKEGASQKSDRINFTMDDKAKNESGSPELGNSYFFRMELEKGNYVLRGLTGFSGVFPVRGHFFAPLHARMESTVPGIFYLGHVNAIVRERIENEFRAGSPLPLVDQAVTGFSGGTFDIEITDQFENDVPEFRARFPALREAVIQKAVLAPFDRAKAQQWWETR
jgi:hypothetical protein